MLCFMLSLLVLVKLDLGGEGVAQGAVDDAARVKGKELPVLRAWRGRGDAEEIVRRVGHRRPGDELLEELPDLDEEEEGTGPVEGLRDAEAGALCDRVRLDVLEGEEPPREVRDSVLAEAELLSVRLRVDEDRV